MYMRMTKEMINRVNEAFAVKNPHGSVRLVDDGFTLCIRYGDSYLAKFPALWGLTKELEVLEEVIKEECGIYAEV